MNENIVSIVMNNKSGYIVFPTGAEDNQDRENVQFAVDAVAPGGTVLLKNHKLNDPTAITPFKFRLVKEGSTGEETIDCVGNTVYLTTDVIIEGEVLDDCQQYEHPKDEKHPNGWKAGLADKKGTTIDGGRQTFKVQDNSIAVTIKNIRFTNFYQKAIDIRKLANPSNPSQGPNEISGCSFVNYRRSKNVVVVIPKTSPKETPDELSKTHQQYIAELQQQLPGAKLVVTNQEIPGEPDFAGAWPILASGDGAELLIQHNYFEAATFDPDPITGLDPITGKAFAGINNLLHVDCCNLKFRFVENRIDDMYFVGIAVWANEGETEITGNSITKKNSFYEVGWPGAAISVGFDPYGTTIPDGKIVIQDNEIHVQSVNTSGIMLCLYPYNYTATITTDPIVSGNTVNMIGPTEDDETIEKYDRAALACFGACKNSKWTGNIVTGEAAFGIWVSHFMPGTSIDPALYDTKRKASLHPSNNNFSLNNLEGFTASKAQVLIGTQVYAEMTPVPDKKNVESFAGTPSLTLDTNYFGHVSGNNNPMLDNPVSGILCKGSGTLMTGNEFQESEILGWDGGDHVGCIYLTKESRQNTVRYSKSQFPDGTFPPSPGKVVEDQIYWDKLASKQYVEEQKNIIEEEKTFPLLIAADKFQELKEMLKQLEVEPIPGPPVRSILLQKLDSLLNFAFRGETQNRQITLSNKIEKVEELLEEAKEELLQETK